MGFWSGFSKVIQGKPVFEMPADGHVDTEAGAVQPFVQEAPRPADPTTTAINSSGYKIIPEVSIKHCVSRLNGSEMEVTVWLTNQSPVKIELNKVSILGATTELGRVMEPGEAHELRWYKGNVPTNDSYHMANLYYKQMSSGDYFCADFNIEYDYDSRGYYMVEDFHPVKPIRDV